MIPNREYVIAWLTINLFQVESVIFEDAWTSILNLEREYEFTPGELRIMRTYAQTLLQVKAA